MFSARFLESGDAWSAADVVSSVYTGFFTAFNPKTDENILIKQLAAPYPDRDYLCIIDGCYTIEFEYPDNRNISGLNQSQRHRESVGEAGDELVERQLARHAAPHRAHQPGLVAQISQ